MIFQHQIRQLLMATEPPHLQQAKEYYQTTPVEVVFIVSYADYIQNLRWQE